MAVRQSSLIQALPKRAVVMARTWKGSSESILPEPLSAPDSPKIIFIDADLNSTSLDSSHTENPVFQLFKKMIQAMGLELSEVAILSSISEMKNASNVPVLVTLGEKSAQDLLKTHTSLNELRGRFHALSIFSGTSKVMPTYHPAELIQNPSFKKAAWEDLQQVMKLLNLTSRRTS